MSENTLPNEDTNNDSNQNQNQNQGKKDFVLEYHLIPGEGCCIFNIVRQHPNVERFLNTRPGGVWRHPTTGVAVTLGRLHPEIIMSGKGGLGVQIRLDGTDGAAIENGHTDITRFAPAINNNVYRDGAINMFNATLKGFAEAVKKHFASEKYVIYKQDKTTKITV